MVVSSQRWSGFGEVVDELIALHLETTGKKYKRQEPEITRHRYQVSSFETGSYQDLEYDQPETWLKQALSISGSDLGDREKNIPKRKGSRQSRILIDLEIMEDAQSLFESVRNRDQAGFNLKFARLLKRCKSTRSLFNYAISKHWLRLEIITTPQRFSRSPLIFWTLLRN